MIEDYEDYLHECRTLISSKVNEMYLKIFREWGYKGDAFNPHEIRAFAEKNGISITTARWNPTSYIVENRALHDVRFINIEITFDREKGTVTINGYYQS